MRDATVLFSGIRNFSSLAEQLNADEVDGLLTHYREVASQPILENGGSNLQFTGDRLIAVFTDTACGSGSLLPVSQQAVSAALALTLAAHEFRGWLAQRFPDCGLLVFAVGVGLHCGDVTLFRLDTGQSSETMSIGAAVKVLDMHAKNALDQLAHFIQG